MKATGIVRCTDKLGRLTLPRELCRTLHISPGDPVEFFTHNDGVFVRKYDVAGDVEQLLDNVEQSIRLSDPLLPAPQMRKLLGKVEEMKAILAEEEK